MKIIILLILAALLMGCTPSASNINSTNPDSDISEYRDGMEAGSAIAAVLVGNILCETFDTRTSECNKVKYQMGSVSVTAIRELSDSDIKALIKQDPTHKGSLKQGSKIFTKSVGDIICSSFNSTNADCDNLKQNITKMTEQFIDGLKKEDIERLQKPPTSAGVKV